jgi:hypothetical protein
MVATAVDFAFTQPRQYPLGDAWGAPFFASDARRVFFVTTTNEPADITETVPIGPKPYKPWIPKLPPIIVKPTIPRPKPNVDPSPIDGVFNPRVTHEPSIETFVSEDAHITRGISSLETVRFADRDIGVSGAVKNMTRGSF